MDKKGKKIEIVVPLLTTVKEKQSFYYYRGILDLSETVKPNHFKTLLRNEKQPLKFQSFIAENEKCFKNKRNKVTSA
jgi:hypothetical protein